VQPLRRSGQGVLFDERLDKLKKADVEGHGEKW
jgi:hypothetical protein